MATAIKSKPQRVRFIADGPIGLTITLKKNTEQYVEGKKQSLGDGQYVRFSPDGMGGQWYETDNPEIIEILRAKMDGPDPKFTEVPIAKPPSAPVLAEITKLAVRGDVEGLVALAKTEEQNHGREDVLDSIADALENLKG